MMSNDTGVKQPWEICDFLDEMIKTSEDFLSSMQEAALVNNYKQASSFFSSNDFLDLVNLIYDYMAQKNNPEGEDCLIDFMHETIKDKERFA